MADLITLTQPRSEAAEAYRTLRTNLIFSNVDHPPRLILVTSPSQGESKSQSLANLAVTLAQADHKTLIVDADLRRPAQHEIWKLSNQAGLSDLFLNDAAFENPPVQETSVAGLFVLTSGPLPPNPADVLASRRMDEIIERLAQTVDYVLFDAPPALVASDAAVLGRKLEGVILVVRAGHTRRDSITQAQESLVRVGANLLGAVMTHAPRQAHTTYG